MVEGALKRGDLAVKKACEITATRPPAATRGLCTYGLNAGDRYSRRVSMEEIEKNDYNLNISRYISTATADMEINLQTVNASLVGVQQQISRATQTHNQFLHALGLPLLPME